MVIKLTVPSGVVVNTFKDYKWFSSKRQFLNRDVAVVYLKININMGMGVPFYYNCKHYFYFYF